MTEQDKCAKCGAPLPDSVRGGLCPACLLKRGLETNTVGFTDEDQAEAARRWTPPTVEQLAPIAASRLKPSISTGFSVCYHPSDTLPWSF